MTGSRSAAQLAQGLLAVLLLVLGQNAAALHPGDHDDGSLRSSDCAACLTAHLLSSACVDTGPKALPAAGVLRPLVMPEISRGFPATRSPRQRSPPPIPSA